MRILCVMSGGLDSAVATAIAHEAYPDAEFYTLHFDYGSRQTAPERLAVEQLHRHYRHEQLFHQSLPIIRGSWLTNSPFIDELPEGVPRSYVPARNLIFISHAASHAFNLGCDTTVLGIHATDSPYPDCTEVFVSHMNLAVLSGTADKVTLRTPLLHMSKKEVVAAGSKLNVPFELTWTCYDPQVIKPSDASENVYWCPEYNMFSCGVCDACEIRIEAFIANGLKDPLKYVQLKGE